MDGRAPYHEVEYVAPLDPFASDHKHTEGAVELPEDYVLFQVAQEPFWKFDAGVKRVEVRRVDTPMLQKRWGPENVFPGRDAVIDWGYGPQKDGIHYRLVARVKEVERVKQFADASETLQRWANVDPKNPKFFKPDQPVVLTFMEATIRRAFVRRAPEAASV